MFDYTEEDLQRIGVYLIANLANSKVYVGQTTKSFKYRWNQHLSSLRKGIHSIKALQQDWSTYGEHCFSFQILEYFPSPWMDWSIKEQYWMDFYKVFDRRFGYNTLPVMKK